ncbi:hypothetical protein CMI47_20580 [Candidatus Pacearchaeota archaeon]|nr:hypothetical protein [Candidatus Pacearchaeota archaeon]
MIPTKIYNMPIANIVDIATYSGAIVPRSHKTNQSNLIGIVLLGLCLIVCSPAKIDFSGLRLVHVHIGGQKNNPGVNTRRVKYIK